MCQSNTNFILHFVTYIHESLFETSSLLNLQGTIVQQEHFITICDCTGISWHIEIKNLNVSVQTSNRYITRVIK